MSIPIEFLLPQNPVVDIATVQSSAELDELLEVTAPKPITRIPDPPEMDDVPNVDVENGIVTVPNFISIHAQCRYIHVFNLNQYNYLIFH